MNSFEGLFQQLGRMRAESGMISNNSNSNSSARRVEEDGPSEIKVKLSPEDIVDLKVSQQKFEALKKQRREEKEREDAEMKDVEIEVVDLDLARQESEVVSDKEEEKDAGKIDGIMSTAIHQPQDDTANYYTCKICMQILVDPKYCTKCETAYCGICIDRWNNESRYGSRQCPASKCAQPKYTPLPRIVKSIMQKMRFYCPQKECKYHVDTQLEKALEMGIVELDGNKLGNSYEKALAHAQRCPFKEQPCELGCGTMLIGSRKAEHLKKCVNYEEQCDKCECIFRPNQLGASDGKDHNCLEILMKKYQANLETTKAMDWQLGINHDRIGVVCPKSGKPMEPMHGFRPKYEMRYNASIVNCDKCDRKNIDAYDIYYTCMTPGCNCDFDLCRLCALQMADPPIINSGNEGTLIEAIHKHPLKPHPINSPIQGHWLCNISKVFPNLTCDSFMDRASSQHAYGMQCRECDFDVCLRCIMRYFGGNGKSLQPEGLNVEVPPPVVRRPPASAAPRPPPALNIRGRVIPMQTLRDRATARFRVRPDDQASIARATAELIARLRDGRDRIEEFDNIQQSESSAFDRSESE